MRADAHDLARFVDAQRASYATALEEIRSGRKRSHWMWYVFPQLAGLGSSTMAEHYSICSLDEARAYLAHDVLGPRLVECAAAVLALEGRSAREIFGSPDDLKLRSSATLFALVSSEDSVFRAVLDRYFGATPDPRTLELLNTRDQAPGQDALAPEPHGNR
jgi:uncharacterized protein (DUF1810 family)